MARALVVDDSRTIRMILTKMLMELGFETVPGAGNGAEALDLMSRYPDIDLVLVDWNMPQMNGLEFVKALRSDVRHAETKVVMVTTETELEQMMAALEAGANEYVMKPFTAEVIEDKLRMVGAL